MDALLNKARAMTAGEVSNTAHAASKARLLEKMEGKRPMPTFVPILAGAAAVLTVTLGASFVLRKAPVVEPEVQVAQVQEEDTRRTDLEETIARARPKFKKCYQAGLAKDPDMQGGVVIKITIETSGQVSASKIEKRDGLSEEVATCLAAVLGEATFPPSQKASTASVPVRFVHSK